VVVRIHQEYLLLLALQVLLVIIVHQGWILLKVALVLVPVVPAVVKELVIPVII
jgi:hypothetical protein